MIKIDFEFQTEFGTFRDALHLPDNEIFTEEQLAAMKQQRLDNWLAIINAPAPEEVPVVDGSE